MNLRSHLRKIFHDEVEHFLNKKEIAHLSVLSEISLDYTPKLSLGHYASNAAMLLAKLLRRNPMQIADELKETFDRSRLKEWVSEIQIAPPGFINFFLKPTSFRVFFDSKFSLEKLFDSAFSAESSQNIQTHFEFVSANPTGPLNIVSARSAAVGDSICRVLTMAKKKVYREYYVNDFGGQIQLLGISLGARYLLRNGVEAEIPENGYKGQYLKEVLEQILSLNSLPNYIADIEFLKNKNLSEEDKNAWLEKASEYFSPLAIEILLQTHKKDLADFRVEFDNFFSEKSLHEKDKVNEVIQNLEQKKLVYTKDGAVFFKSTSFKDDKDRVLKRNDGRPTYFLADVAYHLDKFQRGHTNVYDIWGPDHHGYIARLTGALEALECMSSKEQDKSFKVLIVQQVNLMEAGKTVVMSKRLGKFHTMRDLIEKVPVDVSRYFFVSRSQNQHLDFDLELALERSSKNPVYYIQYAHARIHSIYREATPYLEKIPEIQLQDVELNLQEGFEDLVEHLETFFKMADSEREGLIFKLIQFTDEIEIISRNMEVHRLAVYLYKLAEIFTRFYHSKPNRILSLLQNSEKSSLLEAIFLLRICQITATVLKEGLALLGIQAPKGM